MARRSGPRRARGRGGSRLAARVLLTAALVAFAAPAFAYLKFGFDIGGRQVALRWPHMPIDYFVTDLGVNGVTSADFQAAVGRAFATWQAVPTSSVAYRFQGFTASLPSDEDGKNTLGFQNRPELDRVLASTSYLIDGSTGELLEADIFFNSAFPWSVSPNGDRTRWDLESIALHEIGHLSGLGHSAIGETEVTASGRRVLFSGAVMFPIALGAGDTSSRQLRADDIAGISDLYPDGGFADDTGTISGSVTKNGRGVFGAHVVAFDPATGELVGNFTLDTQGNFSIAGLHPGPHVLRVEPIDDAAVDSFFDATEPVDINLGVKFYERLVVVPRRGDSGAVQMTVTSK